MPSNPVHRRLRKLERHYRPPTAAADEYIVYGGPEACGPLRATDGKETFVALDGETTKAFRARLATLMSRTTQWITIYGLSAQE